MLARGNGEFYRIMGTTCNAEWGKVDELNDCKTANKNCPAPAFGSFLIIL